MSKYKGEIICTQDIEALYKLFSPELKVDFNQRAGYKVKKKDMDLVITFYAKDKTALKAVINSILRNITVYEGTKEMIENELNTTKNYSYTAESSKSPSPKTDDRLSN